MWFLYAWILVASQALLNENSNPTEQEIACAIEGNLCRCTGYQQIIDSIKAAAEIHRGEKNHSLLLAMLTLIHILRGR